MTASRRQAAGAKGLAPITSKSTTPAPHPLAQPKVPKVKIGVGPLGTLRASIGPKKGR